MKNIQTSSDFKKIRRVLEFVWNSPYSSFYKDKYTKAGINLIKDINSMEDFKKLPFLTREEIIKTDPYERIYFPKEKIKGAQFSSSTTGGKGILIMLKAGFPHPADKLAVQKALDLKIKTAMIVVVSSAAWAINRPAFKDKSITRYLGSIHNLENAAIVIKELRIEGFAATSSILEQLIPHLIKQKALDQIRYISVGGEPCSPLRFDYFKKTFKNAYFRFAYNLTESRATSYVCDFYNNKPPENIVHPLTQYTYFEVNNPEEESELVLTSLYTKTEFPIIRYKTGDMAKVYQEECECGRSMKMKIYGRIGMDNVRVKGNLIYREQIDKAIYPLGKYLSAAAWKLFITNSIKDKSLPKFKLQLIVKDNFNKNIKSDLEKLVSDNIHFLSGKTFSQLVEEKMFSALKIEFVDGFQISPKQKSIFVETI
ncbi:MAG: hypothetical protein PHQ59_00075 [Candidatus Daviesbacteria bacterium]|nr:hypothetical protein [Candidatus Daviesbacteria bacterium]